MADVSTDPKDHYRSIWTYLAQVPFKQDYVQVEDVRVRYVEAGDPSKPTVIMLHGTGGHWEAFCANIGPFSEHFHVLAFDQVGAGFSSKPDRPYIVTNLAKFVKAFMDAMGVKRAHMIGVSLGGWTTARVAVDFPDSIDKIILISPVGLTRMVPTSGDQAKADVARRAAIVRDTSWESTKTIFEGVIHDPRDVLDDFVSMRQTIHRLPDAERDMTNVFSMTEYDNFLAGSLRDEELAALKAPALVLLSEHDFEMFQTTAKVIAELAPHARLVDMSGAAHWAQLERTDVFNEMAIAFLKG